jgi:hypothetical protein
MASLGSLALPPVKLRHIAPVEAFNAGVIDAARRHQRRRRLVVTVACAASIGVGVGASVVLGGSSTPRPGTPAHGSAVNVTPAAVLAGSPYMGVACRVPNSTVCDRVGLAVWLRRPAVAVDATIAGRPLKLDDPLWSAKPHHGRRAMFAGFVQPAGLVDDLHITADPGPLRWWAPSNGNAPSPRVSLRIDYGNGKTLVTQLDVYLSAGWG